MKFVCPICGSGLTVERNVDYVEYLNFDTDGNPGEPEEGKPGGGMSISCTADRSHSLADLPTEVGEEMIGKATEVMV
jgi:hypothetical protein